MECVCVCASSLFLLLLCVIGLLGQVAEPSLLGLPDSDSMWKTGTQNIQVENHKRINIKQDVKHPHACTLAFQSLRQNLRG